MPGIPHTHVGRQIVPSNTTKLKPTPCSQFYPDASTTFATECESGLWDALYIGNMIGVLMLGPVADSVGRWRILFVSTFFIVTFGLLSALASSYSFLWSTRLVVGFWEGGSTVAIDLVAEFMQVLYV